MDAVGTGRRQALAVEANTGFAIAADLAVLVDRAARAVTSAIQIGFIAVLDTVRARGPDAFTVSTDRTNAVGVAEAHAAGAARLAVAAAVDIGFIAVEKLIFASRLDR